MLSIIDIIEDTTVDGPGFRTAIYAAGCPNACPGCHNPESWDIKKGKQISTEEILTKVLADDFANVTFSGGDPMFQPEGFTKLAQAIKEKSRKKLLLILRDSNIYLDYEVQLDIIPSLASSRLCPRTQGLLFLLLSTWISLLKTFC